jgi:hypothetical protein
MDEKELLAGNDKVNKLAQEKGYCCAFVFFETHKGKRDSHKRLANLLGVGVSTIQFNRRKIRNGGMTCPCLKGCQLPENTNGS